MTEFGSSMAHPMKKKEYAHETLSLLINRKGVPPKMVMYGSKDQKIESFRKKCQDADCHMNQKEPYYPWKLQAEGTIR